MSISIDGSANTIGGLVVGGLPVTTVTPPTLGAFNALGNYANDAAAQAGGVVVGGMYRNGSVIMVRVA